MSSIIPQIIANSIIAGSIYALVALGFNLIFSTTRFFNLAHGVLSAVGAYAVFFLVSKTSVGLALAIIIAVIFSGLVGYFLDKLVFLKLRQRKSSNMVLLVASLGLMTAIQAVLAIIFTSQFQTLNSVFTTKTYDFGGAIMTNVQLYILASSIVIGVLLYSFIKWTKFGIAVRAVADEEGVAKVVGINTDRIISTVFFIGSALAGYAGIMVALDTGMEPIMGMNLLLKGVIASIIGGIGSTGGGVLGAFLLAFIENFGILKVSGEWKDAIAFIVLIVFMLWRPQGIISKK